MVARPHGALGRTSHRSLYAHDFRRTARSNTKRRKVDFETAEAMLNHAKKGLERTYDLYGIEEEKRASFLKWEQEIADSEKTSNTKRPRRAWTLRGRATAAFSVGVIAAAAGGGG